MTMSVVEVEDEAPAEAETPTPVGATATPAVGATLDDDLLRVARAVLVWLKKFAARTRGPESFVAPIREMIDDLERVTGEDRTPGSAVEMTLESLADEFDPRGSYAHHTAGDPVEMIRMAFRVSILRAERAEMHARDNLGKVRDERVTAKKALKSIEKAQTYLEAVIASYQPRETTMTTETSNDAPRDPNAQYLEGGIHGAGDTAMSGEPKRIDPLPITHHHDGHGLNESLVIHRDTPDPENGNASHGYTVGYVERGMRLNVAHVDFQHGPRDEEDSTTGCTDATLLAIVLDRYNGFQSGKYRCRENALVITKLEEALHWMKHRADGRAGRGVLGKNEV
jgi:hypothetical protein